MIFNEIYNRERFSEFLRNFLPEDFVERKQDLSHIDSCKVINQAYELGISPSLGVHVLEMGHKKDTDPRVAIATDAFRILATYQIDKALVIFKSENSDNYRFSLLTISLDVNEKNKLIKTYSNARRFSFYLGPGAKVRTPEHQLVTKGRIKDVTDLVDRFSLEVVNKQFYLELVKHFDALVDDEKKILSLPYQSDPNVRKSFAMRLIGRIMFCWFLKQKHSPTDGPLIPDALLSSKSVKDGYYHGILEPLFFGILNTPMEGRDIRGDIYDSVPYLNGGLFNPQHDDYYDLDREILVSKYINTLVISDEWFRNFFSLLETYNFTIDENMVFDQELSVDPEMLGRIFENLLAEINPETGSSERKRTGSYYTPRQIVEYMVDRSLIEHLKTKTGINEKKLEALVSYDLNDDSENPLTLPERKLVIDAIDSLRLLDPACGSGAFPIGALQKIVWILQRVDSDCELWLEKKLAKVPELYKQKIRKDATTNPFDYTRKLDVIKNSIFGVDIQPIAVEIARLRCFLTLVVESEVNDSKPNRGVDPLPNLDFKFVCANTLIPAPEESNDGQRLFTDDFEEKLSAAVDRYFSSFGASKSSAGNDIHRLIDSKVDEQLRYVRNLISHSDERYQAVLAKTHKKSIDTHTHVLTLWASYKNLFENKPVGFFDPKYFFPGVKNGFDVVIANPPYITVSLGKNQKIFTVQEVKLLNDIYKNVSEYKNNTFSFFINRGIDLVGTAGGIVCYIVPNTLLFNASFSKVRKYILDNTAIRYLIDIKNKVFDSAEIGGNCVFVLQKAVPDTAFYAVVSERDGFDELKYQKTKQETFLSTLDYKFYCDNDNHLIFKKITENSKALSELGNFYNGIKTGNNKEYLTDKNSDVFDELVYRGRDIFRYHLNKPTSYVHFDKDKLWSNTNEQLLRKSPKVLFRQTGDKIVAAIEVDGALHMDTTHSFFDFKEDQYFLLSLFNSKLIDWWHKFYTSESNRVFAEVKIANLKNMPIRVDREDLKESCSNLVKKILEITNSSDYLEDTEKQERVKTLEEQINDLVYKLYGLTEEEIKIVENEK